MDGIQPSEFNVVLAEDDPEFATSLSGYLTRYGVRVTHVVNLQQLTAAIESERPQILVLDQFLGASDALLALPTLRNEFDGGIVLLTGNQSSVDRIVALECGADEFISKTCDVREILARLRAILRRMPSGLDEQPLASQPHTEFAVNLWEIDEQFGTIKTPAGSRLRLTSMEFDFLCFMQKHKGELLTRDAISETIMRRKFDPSDRSIDNMLSNIRRLLAPHLGGDPFRSIRGGNNAHDINLMVNYFLPLLCAVGCDQKLGVSRGDGLFGVCGMATQIEVVRLLRVTSYTRSSAT
eukprot:gene1377-1396_t